MEQRESLGQRESETGAFVLAPRPEVHLVELAKDRLQVGFRDADARVGDRDFDRLFDAHAAIMPNFAEYQRNTTRVIPVVILDRIS